MRAGVVLVACFIAAWRLNSRYSQPRIGGVQSIVHQFVSSRRSVRPPRETLSFLLSQVHSMLPQPVSLHSLALRLTLLQETSGATFLSPSIYIAASVHARSCWKTSALLKSPYVAKISAIWLFLAVVTTFESPRALANGTHSRTGSVVGESLGTAASVPAQVRPTGKGHSLHGYCGACKSWIVVEPDSMSSCRPSAASFMPAMNDTYCVVAHPQAAPDTLPDALAAAPGAAAAAAAAADRAPSFNERISVQWLPTEELLCQPAGAATSACI